MNAQVEIYWTAENTGDSTGAKWYQTHPQVAKHPTRQDAETANNQHHEWMQDPDTRYRVGYIITQRTYYERTK